ncbi:MAG: MmcQ/YjbR family DNA-binding protein [Armatimonadetes bacterium]|nr:MmcQ/YjbR family DNA-binding protein [Armatimonadota bacterium]
MTFDELVAIGLEFDGVEESTSWRTPSLKRKGKFMLRLKEEGDTVAVKLDWENHDRLLAAHPDQIFKTSHYEGYPAFLVRLDGLSPSLAREVVELSWTDAPKAAKSLPPTSA